MHKLALAFIATAFLVNAAHAEKNISHVFKSIYIDANKSVGTLDTVNGSIQLNTASSAQNVSTVNGSIQLEENATAENIETINGSIRLAAGARGQSISTVNGSISLKEKAIAHGDIETVNGSIQLNKHSEAQGNVSNVNGRLRILGATVKKSIQTVSGDISLLDGAHVEGGIKIEKPSAWSWHTDEKKPRVIIGAKCIVDGDLIFEREVDLWVHSSAKIGPVHGAKVVTFESDMPKD